MGSPQRKIKCTDCNRMFITKKNMQEHWRAKHAPPSEPSFASLLLDAKLEVAMGGDADDDFVEHLDAQKNAR